MILAIYLTRIGFSLIQVGLLISSGVLGAAFFSVLVALFADAIGRRRLLVFFALARGAAGIALALMSSFPLLAAICFFTGFAIGGGSGGGAAPLSQAVLAETAPANRRNDLYALYNMLAIGGGAFGTLASGVPVLLQNLGIDELTSYRFAMLWYAFFNCLAALLSFLLSSLVEVSQERRHWANPFRLPSRGRILAVSSLFSVEHFSSALVVQSLVAYWFLETFGVQLQSLAVIFFASNIGAAGSFWLGAKLANRFGLINTIILTHLPSGLLLLWMPFVSDVRIAVGFWLAIVVMGHMAMPMRQSYAMGIVGSRERVAMASLSHLGGTASMVAGPTVATYLWGLASAASPFVASGAIRIIGDVLIYFALRNVKAAEEVRLEGQF